MTLLNLKHVRMPVFEPKRISDCSWNPFRVLKEVLLWQVTEFSFMQHLKRLPCRISVTVSTGESPAFLKNGGPHRQSELKIECCHFSNSQGHYVQ